MDDSSDCLQLFAGPFMGKHATMQACGCRWLENIRDWCISRQLWFGHRIPAWYVQLPGNDTTPPGGPSERMGDWVVGRSQQEAHAAAAKRFPGQDFTLSQVCACEVHFIACP